jgi:Flp pilus assembly protein TadG
MFGRLRNLGRDSRGVSVVEFAFIGPTIVLLILGVVDGARAVSAKLTLDQVVYRALEKAQVGTTQSDYDTFLKAEVTNAGIPAANATVSTWLQCDNETPIAITGTCDSGEQTTRYVQLTVTNTFAPSFGYGKWFLGANASTGLINLSSTASLRIQ